MLVFCLPAGHFIKYLCYRLTGSVGHWCCRRVFLLLFFISFLAFPELSSAGLHMLCCYVLYVYPIHEDWCFCIPVAIICWWWWWWYDSKLKYTKSDLINKFRTKKMNISVTHFPFSSLICCWKFIRKVFEIIKI